MTLVPMRFDGVSWHHNPKEIKFECDKSVKELVAPYGQAYIQNLGRKNMKVIGVGELYGEDCFEQFENLLNLFCNSREGILSIPKIAPFYAVFETLKILGEPKPNILTYSFVFREKMRNPQIEPVKTHKCKNGENLWDVSYMYNIPIDTLVELKKWVKRPDMIDDGSVVALC